MVTRRIDIAQLDDVGIEVRPNGTKYLSVRQAERLADLLKIRLDELRLS